MMPIIFEQPRSLLYLLRDGFHTDRAAGSVNGTPAEPGPGGNRLIRDVENKIAIAGGTENWTAQATPVWGDQDRVYSQLPITRAFGVVAICKYRISVLMFHFPLAFVTSQTPVWFTNVNAGFIMGGDLSGTLYVVYEGITGPIVATIVVGTDYLLAIELRAAGAKWYIKGGAFANWTKLFEHTLGSATPLYVASAGSTAVFALDNVRSPSRKFYDTPLASDSFNRANGALGITDGLGHAEANGGDGLAWQFDSGVWAVSGNAAVGTPTQGAELAVNGGMEGVYVGGLAPNWTKVGSPTLAESADVHGGSKAQQFASTIANDRVEQSKTLIVGTWYMLVAWGKRTVTSVARTLLNFYSGVENGTSVYSDAIYTQKVVIARAIITGGFLRAVLCASASASDTVLVDDVSFTNLSLPSLFSSLTLSTVNVMQECVIKTLIAGTQAGCVARLNNAATPTSGIIAYWDGNGNVKVDEFTTATVWTNLLSVIKAYATGDKLVLWLNGSAWQLYHFTAAGVAVLLGSGTTAVLTGNLFGNFSTYAGNAIESCNVYPVGAEGQWNGLNLF